MWATNPDHEITAVALCPAPPLLARELSGAEPVLPALRRACGDAVSGLVASRPTLIAVVGTAEQTQAWDSHLQLDLSRYAPGIGRLAGTASPAAGTASLSLPLPVGLGARLLDQAGYTGRRLLFSVGHDEPASRCAELGARIAGVADRVALLMMADGSARRGPKAPGYLDERSFPFDAEVERAVRAGDTEALLALDPDLARDLMATGRPVWQVLAGALRGIAAVTEVGYSDDPFGVSYLVASLRLA